MNNNNNGSLLLAQLIAISILLVISLAGWYSFVQLRLLAQARYTYQKERSLIEGLLNNALSLCLEKPEACLDVHNNLQSWELLYDPWPSPALTAVLGHYRATVVIAIHDKKWYITGTLLQGSDVLRRGSCTLCPEQVTTMVNHPQFFIDNWMIT